MTKFMRRIATATACAAITGGALLTAGSSATAATVPIDGNTPARATVAVDTRTGNINYGRRYGYRNAHDSSGCYDGHGRGYTSWDWCADDRFYPWVYDQLEIFRHSDNVGHQCFANDWHHSIAEN